MEIIVDGKNQELVQLHSLDSELPKGLYLIPYGTIDKFEMEVEKFLITQQLMILKVNLMNLIK